MIGQRLGPWVIDAEIGRGAMGSVYRARRAADAPGEPAVAAVKVLNTELARDAVFVGRFRREIAAVEQLNHPNIVRFYEAGAADGVFYYAMEFVDGPDYQAILADRGRLSWTEVLALALQVVPALKHAHDRGIIHRDLKPSNLLRMRNGEAGAGTGEDAGSHPALVKLTDFGVAKLFAQPALTAAGSFVGTAAYLAPEQAAGKPATKRSDLYSFGGVLYTLLTGRPPFPGENVAELLHKHCYQVPDRPQRLVPDIPHDVDALVMQLLEKDPSRRPADGLVLIRQLERLRGKYQRKQADLTSAESPPEDVSGDAPTVVHGTAFGGSGGVSPPSRRPEIAAPGVGPATLAAGLMRQELEDLRKGGPVARFFNHPLVLVAMLAACVGLIAYGFARKRPRPDELFAQAQPLMETDRPADWRRAWAEYLEPLEERFPGHVHEAEVRAFRQKMLDVGEQDRALDRAKAEAPKSEAERFYRQGLALLQTGDAAGARRIWQGLVTAFRGVATEERWVTLAARGLGRLEAPAGPPRRESVEAALARARQLRDAGKMDDAKRVWNAIEALYADDPAGRDVMTEVKRDRGD
jgi:eukaryotic-like serine/threonine-protein kinase